MLEKLFATTIAGVYDLKYLDSENDQITGTFIDSLPRHLSLMTQKWLFSCFDPRHLLVVGLPSTFHPLMYCTTHTNRECSLLQSVPPLPWITTLPGIRCLEFGRLFLGLSLAHSWSDTLSYLGFRVGRCYWNGSCPGSGQQQALEAVLGASWNEPSSARLCRTQQQALQQHHCRD
jgi:hypothetical protein